VGGGSIVAIIWLAIWMVWIYYATHQCKPESESAHVGNLTWICWLVCIIHLIVLCAKKMKVAHA